MEQISKLFLEYNTPEKAKGMCAPCAQRVIKILKNEGWEDKDIKVYSVYSPRGDDLKKIYNRGHIIVGLNNWFFDLTFMQYKEQFNAMNIFFPQSVYYNKIPQLYLRGQKIEDLELKDEKSRKFYGLKGGK